MNDSLGPGGFNFNETATTTTSDRKAEGVVPFVIRQILESPDDGVMLWGMNLGVVTFIAIIRSVDHSSTKITYRLEDHTGQIEAHYWLEEGDTFKAPQVVVNGYGRIFGSVRNHGGTKTVMIFRLEPIDSPNDITTHMLEVLNARYSAEDHFKKSSGATAGGGAGSLNNEYFSNGGGNTNWSDNAGGGSGGASGAGNSLGLTGKDFAVYEAIRTCTAPSGISIQELQKKFTHINEANLRIITDNITMEGHIYTSVDTDHFLCTDP